MTQEEYMAQRSMISQFLMRAALPLGVFFMLEYMMTYWMMGKIWLMPLRYLLAVGTPVALFVILRTLRDRIMGGAIRGLQAWIYGVQVVLFAALLEAAWIYVFHEFIQPDSLAQMQANAIAQVDQSLAMIETLPEGTMPALVEQTKQMADELRSAAIPSAINTAVSQISTELFVAMLLMLFIAPIVRKRPQTQA